MDWNGLPGEELVAKGLTDLESGEETVESLLVLIGAPRLRDLGMEIPAHREETSPEHRLYELLSGEYGDAAHSRYNALLRRLISFERAAACVRS